MPELSTALKATKLGDNLISVEKTIPEQKVTQTYHYEFLVSQRAAIQKQADDSAAARQKELDDIDALLAECEKLDIKALPAVEVMDLASEPFDPILPAFPPSSMQKKVLDISLTLKDFKGEDLKDEKGEPITLSTVLLGYLLNAHRMNLTGNEEPANAYGAGTIIGSGKDKVQLTVGQWEVLKKLVQHNKVSIGQGQEPPLYGIVVTQQVLDASNHVCLLLEQSGLLFTGDHLMSGSTVIIIPPDGSMRLYLESLDRLRQLPLAALAPGHGALMPGAIAEIGRVMTHRLAREAKLARALGTRRAASLDDVLAEVYDDVPQSLHVYARYSLLAHAVKLVEEGRARLEGELYVWYGE